MTDFDMKALILAAGKGTRLKPLTDHIAKHLVPVANKPILFYGIEKIRKAGISDIGIVVSPDTGSGIRKLVGDGSRWGCKISYIIQESPAGLAHAVNAARNFLEDMPFLLFLGDNLIKDNLEPILNRFYKHLPEALIVLKKVSDPKAFGVAEVGSNRKVIRVVEKPREPKSDLAMVGVYILTPTIFEIIAKLSPSWRGEYEITDAIQNLLEMGYEVRFYILKKWWLDTGKKEDLLKANQIILQESLKHKIHGYVDASSRIIPPVEIKTGAKISNSRIVGPVSIAEHCHITGSFVGPFTSIGMNSEIEDSTLESSIILEHSHIADRNCLRSTIISGLLEL
jgi:glucose-1-phosphate thymidylyltransferase